MKLNVYQGDQEKKLIGTILIHDYYYLVHLISNRIEFKIFNDHINMKFDKRIETRRFNQKKIKIEQVLDLVKLQITDWDNLIEHFGLTLITSETPKYKITRVESNKNIIKLFNDKREVGSVRFQDDHYQINMLSGMIDIKFYESLTWLKIENSNEIEYISCIKHDITKEKIMELMKTQDLSVSNVESMFNLIRR